MEKLLTCRKQINSRDASRIWGWKLVCECRNHLVEARFSKILRQLVADRYVGLERFKALLSFLRYLHTFTDLSSHA